MINFIFHFLRRCIYIKILLQGEKYSRKCKERNECRKNIIGLKIKIIKRKKKGRIKKKVKEKENSTEMQKSNVDAVVYNNNRKYDWVYTYTPIR